MTNARRVGYRTPSNPNFLSQLGFKFLIKRAPNLEFFVQEAVVPGLTLGVATQYAMLDDIPRPGDRLHRTDLQITFKVDEDMKNFSELYHWMVGLAHPNNFGEYRELAEKSRIQSPFNIGEGIWSDLTLMVQTSKHNYNIEFTFHDAFPVSLSPLRLSYGDEQVEYIDCTVGFRYRHMRMETLSSS